MDLLSNYVCSLKNACKSNKEMVEIQASKVLLAVSSVLKNQGVIESIRVVKKNPNKLFLQVKPAFKKYDHPLLKSFIRISKPGLRKYWSVKDFNHQKKITYGNFILSTPKGVMLDSDAIKNGIGGEVLCKFVKQ